MSLPMCQETCCCHDFAQRVEVLGALLAEVIKERDALIKERDFLVNQLV